MERIRIWLVLIMLVLDAIVTYWKRRRNVKVPLEVPADLTEPGPIYLTSENKGSVFKDNRFVSISAPDLIARQRGRERNRVHLFKQTYGYPIRACDWVAVELIKLDVIIELPPMPGLENARTEATFRGLERPPDDRLICKHCMEVVKGKRNVIGEQYHGHGTGAPHPGKAIYVMGSTKIKRKGQKKRICLGCGKVYYTDSQVDANLACSVACALKASEEGVTG